MCCLFGYYRYGSKIEKISVLTNLLAENAAVRGTDAAGIAYNDNGNLSYIKRQNLQVISTLNILTMQCA